MAKGSCDVTGNSRNLPARFERFADQECERSPLYQRLAAGTARDPELLALAIHGDHGPKPNLFLAAVHFLLLDGARHPLAAFYPTITGAPVPDGDPLPTFRAFALDHGAAIPEIMATRYVQTNEAGRAAILASALYTITSENGGRPLTLVEIGASAGLLLNWDRYRLQYTDGMHAGSANSALTVTCEARGNGRLPDLGPEIEIAGRIGIDLNPIDVSDDHEARWLQALVWPDQLDRFARLAAAVKVARQSPVKMIAGDAIERLPGALQNLPRGATSAVFHCHTLNQFSLVDRQRLDGLLMSISESGPLFRLSLESIGVERDGRMDLIRYQNGEIASQTMLARYDPHGAWIEWSGQR